jgi:hypothetical protein
MMLQIQAQTVTAIWSGGFAVPPAPVGGLLAEDGTQMLNEDGAVLQTE